MRASRIVGTRQQGAGTRWELVVKRKVSWAELWKAEPHCMKFVIQAVCDVLLSLSILHLWGMVEPPACPLCRRRGTLEHILSSCSKALGEVPDPEPKPGGRIVMSTCSHLVAVFHYFTKHNRDEKLLHSMCRSGTIRCFVLSRDGQNYSFPGISSFSSVQYHDSFVHDIEAYSDR